MFGGWSKPAAEGFCNADLGGQKHCHSISGYSFHIGARAISWNSKKQHVVVLSSTKAEYIVQMHMAKEPLWLCSFLQKLHISWPANSNCDNQGAITLCQVQEIYGGNSRNSRRQVRTYEMSEGTLASAYVLRPFQTLVPRFRNREIGDWSKDRSWSWSRN